MGPGDTLFSCEVIHLACSNPLIGWRPSTRPDLPIKISNSLSVYNYDFAYAEAFFKRVHGPLTEVLQIPCGHCLACRLKRASDWSTRIALESTYYEYNWFITLTYDEKYVPHMLDLETGELYDELTLAPRDLQLFMKRLRVSAKRRGLVEDPETGIRFYAAGEYGKRTHRPHYHIILFGLKIPDLKFYAAGKSGCPTYSSDWLQNDVWQLGIVNVGYVTVASAGYVARYCVDKLTGQAAEFYQRFHLHPEFSRMSLKPGIGYRYFQDHMPQLISEQSVVLVDPNGGKRVNLPRYYLRQIENYDEQVFKSFSDRMKYRIETAQAVKNKRSALSPEEQYKLAARLIEKRASRLLRSFD